MILKRIEMITSKTLIDVGTYKVVRVDNVRPSSTKKGIKLFNIWVKDSITEYMMNRTSRAITIFPYGDCKWKFGGKIYNPSNAEELSKFHDALVKALSIENNKILMNKDKKIAEVKNLIDTYNLTIDDLK